MNKKNDTFPINTLSAIDLEKSFKKKRIVRKVSLNVKSGEVVGLLGTKWSGENYMFLHDSRNNPSRQR